MESTSESSSDKGISPGGMFYELTYLDIVSRFSAYSTIHGIPRILTAKGWIKKVLWILLTIVCTGGFVYNFYYLTKNFLTYSVFVKIDIVDSRQLTFPAVSICNTNPVKKSAVGLSSQLQTLLDGWQQERNASVTKKRRRKRASCPNAVEPTSGQCFWSSGSDTFTFDGARQYCIDEGGTLAIVDTQDKFDYLFDTLGYYSCWINLQYNSGAGEWQWGDGTSLSWSNWQTDPGSPPSDMAEICSFVSIFDPSAWQNVDCDGADAFGSVFPLKAICMDGNTSSTDVTATAVTVTTESMSATGTMTETDTTLSASETTTETETTVTTDASSSSTEVTTTFISSFPDREIIREDFKKESDLIEILAEIPLEEKQAMGYNFTEFILSCTYNGKQCDETAFGYFFHVLHGNCYVFNSGWQNTPDIVTSSYSGRRQGLHVLVNIGQHEYVEGVTESAGAVIVVHDHHRMPFPEDEGVFATPGHVTSIGVRRLDIHRLGDQYSECIEGNRNETLNVFAEHFPVNYSVSACEKTCYQKHLILSCGCGDPQYPTEGKALGSGSPQAVVCDSRDNVQDDCVYGLTLQFVNDELDCDCPIPCDDILFNYKISKMQWPMDKAEENILEQYHDQIEEMIVSSSDDQFFRRNLLKVEVYFEELNREILQERPKYPLVRYMSDSGATVGLWMGCSLLSLLEFVEFVVDLIIITCRKAVSTKSLQKMQSSKISKRGKIRKRKITPDLDSRPRRKSQSTDNIQMTSDSDSSHRRTSQSSDSIHNQTLHYRPSVRRQSRQITTSLKQSDNFNDIKRNIAEERGNPMMFL